MKDSIKRVVINVVITVILIFILAASYLLKSSYEYYSVYTKEELAEFFSLKSTILHDLSQALQMTVLQMLIIVPAHIILQKFKIKNFIRIIIATILSMIFMFIFFMLNFSLTF